MSMHSTSVAMLLGISRALLVGFRPEVPGLPAASERVAYFGSLGEVGVLYPLAPDTFVRGVLEYEEGRDNADDPILASFPVIDDTVELQIGVGRQFGDLTLGGAVQVDILGRGKGLVGFVGGRDGVDLGPRLEMEAGIDVSFANATHMNTEVGISAATATASGQAAYYTPGGYKGTTASL